MPSTLIGREVVIAEAVRTPIGRGHPDKGYYRDVHAVQLLGAAYFYDKTGKVPGVNYEQSRLGGVHFYAFLCEQVFGKLPARIQLLYLSEPTAIVAIPSEQSIRGRKSGRSAMPIP